MIKDPNEPLLLHLKQNKRSTVVLPKYLYEKNKAHYDKVGYVIASENDVIEYFKKKGISLKKEVKEVTKEVTEELKTTEKKTKSKKQETNEIAKSSDEAQ